MHPSSARAAVRLSLFTRAHCGLCDAAKLAVARARLPGLAHVEMVDIMAPQHAAWRELYEFDVPVLHVQKAKEMEASRERRAGPLGEPRKLWHRFASEEVERLAAEVEAE